jgi:protein HOOK3
LQKEAEDIRHSNEYKLIKHQLEAVREASADDADQVIEGAATNLTEKIESGRSAVAERDKVSFNLCHSSYTQCLTDGFQQIQEQFLQIQSLSTELEKLKSQPAPATEPSREAALEMANLQRENKLITSAWYDLTCRLQSNTVMLARRQETPKSWIGRQRIAVSGSKR